MGRSSVNPKRGGWFFFRKFAARAAASRFVLDPHPEIEKCPLALFSFQDRLRLATSLRHAQSRFTSPPHTHTSSGTNHAVLVTNADWPVSTPLQMLGMYEIDLEDEHSALHCVSDDVTGFGGVAEIFRIGRNEITNEQYAAFLNAVAANDVNGLYNDMMGSAASGGILKSGVSPNVTYSVKTGAGEWPVNFVSFWDGCRFCNWVHNGRPSGSQGTGTTEDGAYDLTDPGAVSMNTVTRDPDATIHLPTVDQW